MGRRAENLCSQLAPTQKKPGAKTHRPRWHVWNACCSVPSRSSVNDTACRASGGFSSLQASRAAPQSRGRERTVGKKRMRGLVIAIAAMAMCPPVRAQEQEPGGEAEHVDT